MIIIYGHWVLTSVEYIRKVDNLGALYVFIYVAMYYIIIFLLTFLYSTNYTSIFKPDVHQPQASMCLVS